MVVRRGPPEIGAGAADPPDRTAAALPAATPQQAGQHPAAPPALPAGSFQVTAPLLGTFSPRPKPGEPPFVRVGDPVEADTVVAIVEVMKLMNSVTAGRAGTVVAAHAAEGQLVEFGQPLSASRRSSREPAGPSQGRIPKAAAGR